jgi:hypothetical protein
MSPVLRGVFGRDTGDLPIMERSEMIPKAQGLPGGGGTGHRVAREAGAQCWGQ